MKNLAFNKISCCHKSFQNILPSSFRVSFFQVNPFWIQLTYFSTLSLVGYLVLKASKPRTAPYGPKDLDIFFTSVSSATVSSMSTVEMEVFSNTQLVIITILMLVGGEVFTSMLGLQLERSKLSKHQTNERTRVATSKTPSDNANHMELGRLTTSRLEIEKLNTNLEGNIISMNCDTDSLKYKSFKCLVHVVLGYLIVIHICGSSLVAVYTSLVPTARDVISKKGLRILTFSVFTTVSTFANCGFVPTNENMMVFKKNSGLLLILIPQILLGNTLYPPCLRFTILVLEKMTKRVEFRYILMNNREMGYSHLLSSVYSFLLAATVLGFILIQFIVFCSLEWNSEAMDGLSTYQKLVGALFEVVNSRHTGESIFDLSIISPAILVVFVVMMYFPPYTSFLPIQQREEVFKTGQESKTQWRNFLHYLLFSHLSYIVIFIMLICIIERDKMKNDPLNFNVLNITIEVVSAYGNVGFSTGYSCKRQLNPESFCKDASYGFVGWWHDKAKLTLILVMFFGRLKKFSMKGGRAWQLF